MDTKSFTFSLSSSIKKYFYRRPNKDTRIQDLGKQRKKDSLLSIQTICFVIDLYSFCFEQSIYSLVDMIPSNNIEGPTFPRR